MWYDSDNFDTKNTISLFECKMRSGLTSPPWPLLSSVLQSNLPSRNIGKNWVVGTKVITGAKVQHTLHYYHDFVK